MPDELCYLCGLAGADTTEHVIPQCFYEEPLPSDMLTARTHRACNTSTSLDEEWMASVYATCRPLGVGSKTRWDKALRALKREKAAGFRRAFLDSMEPLPSGWAKVTLDQSRVLNVLVKIAKGLHYKYSGELVSDDAHWWVLKIDHAQFVQLPAAYVHNAHDVVALRWKGSLAHAESRDRGLMFGIAILGVNLYAVGALPSGSAGLASVKHAVPMPWPRPMRPRAVTSRRAASGE